MPSQTPLRALRQLLVLLALFAALHVMAMMYFERLTPFEALWLTLTTMTTVGYGDLVAKTSAGRGSTMLLVFFGGIWLAFQSAAVYFEHRADRQQRKLHGRWKWNMTDHILILNVPTADATAYLVRLAGEFRASRRFRKSVIQIVSTMFENGLPEPLHELGVVHYSGEAWDPRALEAADVAAADVIVVLARSESDPSADGRTLDIVDRVRELGAKGRIIAEAVDDANRKRLARVGADIVIRPLRGYPEMIVRALAAPGAEKILEDLFTSERDECWRYDVRVSGLRWADLVATLVCNDIGVPIAYRSSADEQVQINPRADTMVAADKVYVLVREHNARPDAEIEALLERAASAR